MLTLFYPIQVRIIDYGHATYKRPCYHFPEGISAEELHRFPHLAPELGRAAPTTKQTDVYSYGI